MLVNLRRVTNLVFQLLKKAVIDSFRMSRFRFCDRPESGSANIHIENQSFAAVHIFRDTERKPLTVPIFDRINYAGVQLLNVARFAGS